VSDSNQMFENVISGLRKIFKDKNAAYGNSAFEHDPGVSSFQLWMRLSDVRRKTTRLNQLTDCAARGNRDSLDKLIDDYKDLAIYAIIAVAVLEEIE
jgi:hypothetical protein